MAVWSSLFITEGSTTSSDSSSVKATGRCFGSLADTLRCYVCSELFSRPRILPCGHTFCAHCLHRLRLDAQQEFNKSRDRNAHRRGDCGFFTCPLPSCHYSMKIMNVSRWSLRNRAMAHSVAMAKRFERDRQTSATQTSIDLRSAIVSIPKLVFNANGNEAYLSPQPATAPPSPQCVVIQHALQNALSTEFVDAKHYQPPSDSQSRWKSYAFAVGLAVLDQMLKLT